MIRKIRFITVFFIVLMGSLAGYVAISAEDNHSVLVVYYSRDGHTQRVAEKLAEKFEADIERLIDQKKRTGFFGITAAGKDAVAKNLTVINSLNVDISLYDIVLIGTPSWFGNMTPAVRTFVTENDLTGKKIGVFGTAHLTGVENALGQLAELVKQEDGQVIPIMALRHRDLSEEVLLQKIDIFYQELMNNDEPFVAENTRDNNEK